MPGIPTVARGDAGGRVTDLRIKLGRRFAFEDLLSGGFKWIQQESTFWRRSLCERAGGRLDSEIRLAVDFELWRRFFRQNRLYAVAALVGEFRLREGQRSAAVFDEYLTEAEGVIERKRSLLASGAINSEACHADRRSDRSPRERIRSRVSGRIAADVTRAQFEAALLRRWALKITPTSQR